MIALREALDDPAAVLGSVRRAENNSALRVAVCQGVPRKDLEVGSVTSARRRQRLIRELPRNGRGKTASVTLVVQFMMNALSSSNPTSTTSWFPIHTRSGGEELRAAPGATTFLGPASNDDFIPSS